MGIELSNQLYWPFQEPKKQEPKDEKEYHYNFALNKEAFCGDIARERLVRGLNLRDMARESGVSASTINRIERGENMEMESFVKICNWLQKIPHNYFGILSKVEVEK